MAILWERSLVPWLDANGDPYSGAKAFFYDAGTLTPLVTYTTADLSIPNDFPVVAGAGGMFPPVFLPEQITYHLRIEAADGSTLWDVDWISAPTTVVPDPPSGDTPAEFLYQTGDMKLAWRMSVPNGYVRANGRTIGSATSGATERANADCQDLFLLLWTEDPSLAVTGGRGATALGDWSAAKTIALPDLRGRTLVGLDGMGGADANRVIDADTTGGNSNALGASGGENRHALATAEIASHTHSGTTASSGAHTHQIQIGTSGIGDADGGDGRILTSNNEVTATVTSSYMSALSNGAHTHTFTTDNGTGTGTAHNNMQPFAMLQFFIKL